ncbi:hypothetical protein HY36_11510 [Hyphomonas atlantica]|uniref:Lipoprotein n=2 Tax=Hyphomonas atlantica TaxID=1280948 RepID=A0A059DVL6_9PROT|nr:hypothetical protein HY36_11510 [Hyphomonas atlantica]
MVRAAVISLTACFMLPGCTTLPFFGATCPEITDTSAWINRMPGPGQPSGGKLHVVVRVADDQSWMLTPQSGHSEGLLVLDLSKGGPSVPGTAAYQQSRKPLPQHIQVQCQGKRVATIDEITVAY